MVEMGLQFFKTRRKGGVTFGGGRFDLPGSAIDGRAPENPCTLRRWLRLVGQQSQNERCWKKLRCRKLIRSGRLLFLASILYTPASELFGKGEKKMKTTELLTVIGEAIPSTVDFRPRWSTILIGRVQGAVKPQPVGLDFA